MIKMSICVYCKHRIHPQDFSNPTCNAFPNGIPKDIVFSKVLHNKPYLGDNGIVFEPENEKEWEETELNEMFQ